MQTINIYLKIPLSEMLLILYLYYMFSIILMKRKKAYLCEGLLVGGAGAEVGGDGDRFEGGGRAGGTLTGTPNQIYIDMESIFHIVLNI